MERSERVLKRIFKTYSWRKYELQEVLGISRDEVNELLDRLEKENKVVATTQGWKWVDEETD